MSPRFIGGGRRHLRDASHAPKAPFVLNKDSPQARGLIRWLPGYPYVTSGVMKNMVGPTGGAAKPEGDATLIDTASNSIERDPFNTRSLRFGGATASVGYSIDGNPLNLNFVSSATVIFWAKDETTSGSANRLMGNAANDLEIAINRSGSTVVRMLDDNVGFYIAGHTSWENIGAFPAGTWAEIGVALSDTAGINGYINGTNGYTDATNWTNGIDKASRFGTSSSGGEPTDATFKNIRIYDRALTADEIAIYHSPENRWDLYYELSRTFYSIPAAAGGVIIVLTTPSWAWSPQALSSKADTADVLSVANFKWLAQAFNINAGIANVLSVSNFKWLAQVLTTKADTSNVLSAATLKWLAQALTVTAVTAGTVHDLTAATWSWAAQSLSTNVSTLNSLTAPVWKWAAQVVTTNAGTDNALTAPVWKWAAQSFVLKTDTSLTLAIAAFKWAGQAITITFTSTVTAISDSAKRIADKYRGQHQRSMRHRGRRR